MICPEQRHLQEGAATADSYTFNPHKWMFTNFDCNCFYVADRAALIRTLSILPEYLKNEATTSGLAGTGATLRALHQLRNTAMSERYAARVAADRLRSA